MAVMPETERACLQCLQNKMKSFYLKLIIRWSVLYSSVAPLAHLFRNSGSPVTVNPVPIKSGNWYYCSSWKANAKQLIINSTAGTGSVIFYRMLFLPSLKSLIVNIIIHVISKSPPGIAKAVAIFSTPELKLTNVT